MISSPEYIKKAIQAAYNNGGFSRLSPEWTIQVNKQYYFLYHSKEKELWSLARKLNKNTKNILEHFYSENEAIEDTLNTIFCIESVNELIVLMRKAYET
jgi:hypothetical protein